MIRLILSFIICANPLSLTVNSSYRLLLTLCSSHFSACNITFLRPSFSAIQSTSPITWSSEDSEETASSVNKPLSLRRLWLSSPNLFKISLFYLMAAWISLRICSCLALERDRRSSSMKERSLLIWNGTSIPVISPFATFCSILRSTLSYISSLLRFLFTIDLNLASWAWHSFLEKGLILAFSLANDQVLSSSGLRG